MAAAEILLAEDEASIREALTILFEDEGYAVRAAADGEAALRLFRERCPDLILLDVMMPKKNGYAVCREIRGENRDVPVLFLTAKDGDADELKGLMLGADDYISKTASMPVVLARVAAVLARTRRTAAETAHGDFEIAGCAVDARRCQLRTSEGKMVELSLREVEMLRYFAQHPGEVLSRDFLFTKFWGVDYAYDDALSTAIRRLRSKLGASGACLEAIYGNGYRFRPKA